MLKRIKAKNFKSFKTLDLECKNLNLLMGMNGAGKSSFVQLLLFLRATEESVASESIKLPLNEKGLELGRYSDLKYCYAGEEDPIVFDVDFSAPTSDAIDIVIYKHGREAGSLTRVVSEARSPGVVEIRRPYSKEMLKTYDAFKRKWEALVAETGCKYFDLKDNHPGVAAKLNAATVEACQKLGQEDENLRVSEECLSEAYRSLWRNCKFVSCYRVRPQQVHGAFHCSNPEMEGLHFNPEGDDVVGYLSRLNAGYPMGMPGSLMRYPGVSDSGLITQVNAWMQVVSPGSSIHVESVELGEDRKCILSVGYADENEEVRLFKPENVGLGISYVLPVLVTLLSSFEGDIVVIENPEAHLHPKGQAKMGELIARAAASGVQVFVETHSDHVVNGVRGAVKDGILPRDKVGISYFERKVDENEVYSEVRNIKIDSHGSLSEYPDGFMDEWNNQLMELID